MLLIFALLLFAGVLISCRARQTVLSTSVLFLITGLLLGRFVHIQIPQRSLLYSLAEVALYSVLFSDGMKTGGLSMLRSRWRPVARTLGIGMPLNILLIAALAHWLLSFGWRTSLVLGAVLSPTDPVFVSAIFAMESVPTHVKDTLSIESGFNDGLVLPVIFLLLPQLIHLQSGSSAGAGTVVIELIEGIGLGVAIPLAAMWIEQLRIFGAAGVYERLNPFAIALILYAVCESLHANLFLAGFTAGLSIATRRSNLHEAFEGFSEPVTELLKLATILVFSLRVSPLVLSAAPWRDYILVISAAFLARLLAVPIALARSGIGSRDRMLIAWFGPKGFASLVYGIMLLEAGSNELNHAATIVAITVAASIFVYSSTDVLVGNRQKKQPALNS
jgi:sodium/hydrogen antiporter